MILKSDTSWHFEKNHLLLYIFNGRNFYIYTPWTELNKLEFYQQCLLPKKVEKECLEKLVSANNSLPVKWENIFSPVLCFVN